MSAKTAGTYSIASVPAKAKKYVFLAKVGKFIVKKGLPKGTYSVKIKAIAAAGISYKAASKVAALKIAGK